MTDSTDTTAGTSNEQLAAKIMSKFESDQLIPSAKHDEILLKLANGTATESDWKLWLDLPLMEKEARR